MRLADLYLRAPYRVRHGTQAIVEDRQGVTAFVVPEPVHFPAERIAFAEAWCAQVNAAAREAEQARPFAQAAE